MLTFPSRPVTRAPHRAYRHWRWTLESWSRSHAVRACGPGPTLSALLGVLAHRYAMPCSLSADVGCGAPQAVRGALDAAPLQTTWQDALRAVVGTPPADDPTAGPQSLAIRVVKDSMPATPADLLWTAEENGISATWDPDVIPDTTVETMAHHVGRLLGELERPDAPPLADVCFLTPEELAVNGGTPARLPSYPPTPLHQLFMLQAWRTPQACAIRMGDDTLTYAELDVASNELAQRLVTAGVVAGDVVAVGGERSPGLFAALIAVLKAGGVFVYLDPDHPAHRLTQFVRVSRPRVLMIGPGSTAPHFPEIASLDFPGMPCPDADRAAEPPDILVSGESPAYILFTSGSTGVPKGVLRPHRLHTSRVFLEQGLYPLGPGDRVLVKTVISAREVFWPLSTGATLVIARPGGERDDEYLIDLIEKQEISVVSAPGVWLQAFAAHPRFARCTSLRHVFAGGEALHTRLEQQIRSLGFSVHNTYTLTEADYVLHRSGPAAAVDAEYSVMGAPLDMRVYVCDEHGRLVPPGLVGEMWTGGPGLAAGYYGDEAMSAQKFVPNPFGDGQVPVLCRTGDMARHLPDGMLEYRGRMDLQVKVRGQRLEPTEVEAWITQHSAVRNAAVVGYPDDEQGAVLIAYVVFRESAVADSELRSFLARRVPEFMIPRHFVPMPELPLLPNGKIDRASLRLPDRSRPAELAEPAPPENRTQHRVLAVWHHVLRTSGLGVDDDYAGVGGDSLRVLVLRAMLQDEFGVTVDLGQLLGAPTVREQAAMLDGHAITPEQAAPAHIPAARLEEQQRRATLLASAQALEGRTLQ
ncbi:non-ribosomal peptide synthetase [Streptomyces sp. NPDC002285]